MSNFKSQISSLKFIGLGYLIAVIGLFLYSFTQVDLSLTLSRWSIWQAIQKYFQHIGYFQRPLSSGLFTGIVLLLFFFYLMILRAVHKGIISKKTIWFLIISTAVILTFSYNAFSYDLFNYIFDAKIVTFYHQNPYLHKALDYTSDPMLSFMHWTHRLYPYGPVWLGLTVPLSFIGIQIFLPTFFLFKILISLSFLGTAFYVGKILQKFSPKDELFGIAFFALNPLVIIEGLVSAHNDMSMMFFAMAALYLLINIKHVRSIILLILSIGVKFATAFLLPVYAYIAYLQRKKMTINWEFLFIVMTGFMVIPIIVAAYRTTFQPWYLLDILPFAALISKKYYVLIPSVIISLISLFEYLPFLYSGNWNNPIPVTLYWMTTDSVLFSIIIVGIWFLKLAVFKKRIK
jgi:hypothetical protein